MRAPAELGIEVLLNSEPVNAEQLTASGVHLNAMRLMACSERPLSDDFWVAASCHREVEIRHACEIGVDFIVVGPVLSTASHPDAKPLGWDAFAELVNHATVPVYALGGVGIDNIAQSKRQGGQGVAGISAYWSAIS